VAEVRPLESVMTVKMDAVDPSGKVTVAVLENGASKQEVRPPAIAMMKAILRKIFPSQPPDFVPDGSLRTIGWPWVKFSGNLIGFNGNFSVKSDGYIDVNWRLDAARCRWHESPWVL
jgi:hypothetical protein